MIIRNIENGENKKTQSLMACAFKYPLDASRVGDDMEEEFIGAFADDNETLMAQIAVKDYKVTYCGKTVGCVGIAGVSTYPEYRREGCIRAIFNEVFRRCADRGWDVSLLYPFSYRYYRKFGYELAFRHKTLSVPFSMLTHIERNNDAVLYNGEEDVLADLLGVYAAYAKDKNLCMVRTDGASYSADPIKSCRYTYLWKNGGTPASYATVTPDGETLRVTELVYTDAASLYGILGFLRLFDGQYKNVYFALLENDSPVDFLVGTDKGITASCADGAEGRVVNVKNVLMMNEYPRHGGSIRIRITGDVIENNNGVFTVSFGDKTDVSFEKDGEWDVSTSINSFSRLVFGGVARGKAAYLADTVIRNKEELLYEMFPERSMNLFERF